MHPVIILVSTHPIPVNVVRLELFHHLLELHRSEVVDILLRALIALVLQMVLVLGLLLLGVNADAEGAEPGICGGSWLRL